MFDLRHHAALLVVPLLLSTLSCDPPREAAIAGKGDLDRATALLQAAEREGGLLSIETPVALMEGRMSNVKRLETALVVRSGLPAPLIITVDDHQRTLSTAIYMAPARPGASPALRFEDGTEVAAPASGNAEDVVSLVHEHLGKKAIERLRITVFRDTAPSDSSAASADSCSHTALEEECNEDSGDCCKCWKWAFCKKSPHCGVSCNMFTGICNKAAAGAARN